MPQNGYRRPSKRAAAQVPRSILFASPRRSAGGPDAQRRASNRCCVSFGSDHAEGEVGVDLADRSERAQAVGEDHDRCCGRTPCTSSSSKHSGGSQRA